MKIIKILLPILFFTGSMSILPAKIINPHCVAFMMGIGSKTIIDTLTEDYLEKISLNADAKSNETRINREVIEALSKTLLAFIIKAHTEWFAKESGVSTSSLVSDFSTGMLFTPAKNLLLLTSEMGIESLQNMNKFSKKYDVMKYPLFLSQGTSIECGPANKNCIFLDNNQEINLSDEIVNRFLTVTTPFVGAFFARESFNVGLQITQVLMGTVTEILQKNQMEHSFSVLVTEKIIHACISAELMERLKITFEELIDSFANLEESERLALSKWLTIGEKLYIVLFGISPQYKAFYRRL